MIDEHSEKTRVLWLRKFGLASANISKVMDDLALRGACIVSLADQYYFTADAVGREKRIKRHNALVWLARILNIGLFILIGFGISVFFSANPITLPTESIAVVLIAGVILSLLLRVILGALEFLTLSLILGILETSHIVGEHLRLVLIKLGLRPRSLKPFKSKFDKSLARGKSGVFRVDDKNWQKAVSYSIENVHVAVIDITHLTENIMWEVDTVFRNKRLNDIRLICDTKIVENAEQVQIINDLMQPYYSDTMLPVFVYDLTGMYSGQNLEIVYAVHGFVLNTTLLNTGHFLPLTPRAPIPVLLQTGNSAQRSGRRRRRR